MPELPEVETIRRGLDKCILNKRIKSVTILCEKSWRGLDKALIEGQKIIEIDRRGKALLMQLENKLWLMTHLRHTRIYFEFTDGTHLYFNDQRKFGFIKALDELGLAEDEFLKRLAPEPWDMSEEEFWQRLQRHQNSIIKAVILDQHVIAGVGNIYADEGCYLAGLYPGTRVKAISRETADELLHGLREVMQRSIDSGGSTMKDYVRADGTRGSYLEKFAQVFRRDGEACRKCGSEILKTRVAGRGTHYCPKCQPKGKVDA